MYIKKYIYMKSLNTRIHGPDNLQAACRRQLGGNSVCFVYNICVCERKMWKTWFRECCEETIVPPWPDNRPSMSAVFTDICVHQYWNPHLRFDNSSRLRSIRLVPSSVMFSEGISTTCTKYLLFESQTIFRRSYPKACLCHRNYVDFWLDKRMFS